MHAGISVSQPAASGTVRQSRQSSQWARSIFPGRDTALPDYSLPKTLVDSATVISGVFVYIQALTEGVFTDPAGLPLGTATHFHSVAIATQPVHRLQIRPVVHN